MNGHFSSIPITHQAYFEKLSNTLLNSVVIHIHQRFSATSVKDKLKPVSGRLFIEDEVINLSLKWPNMETDKMIKDRMEVIETRTIQRISLPQMFGSLLDAFNLDRGVLYTLKQLFMNPGKAIVSFLGTGRYHFVPPFRLLVVTTAIVLYLISLSKSVAEFGSGFNESLSDANDATKVLEVQQAMASYMNLTLWTFIPVIALLTYALNRKKGFNYAEHLVFHTYLFCIANIFGFFLPLDHYLPISAIWLMVYVPMVFYYIYGYRFFLAKSWFRAVLEMTIIFLVSMVIWGVLFGGAMTFGALML